MLALSLSIFKFFADIADKWCKPLLMLFTCLLFLPQAYAFKIDTHLWIGQQVINDVEDDGNISLKLGNRYITLPVSPNTKEAILSNRNEFLIGNIGPDALPDVVVGQMLVHPGHKDGWKTNDWLNYLLRKSANNPLATAFTYGYLGHAAADVFAHTYVNQYAGDIFLLTDNETLVEQRHVALEGFISNHTPPFLNVNGQDLGNSWTLVQPSDGLATFVRDNLIFADEAIAQYDKEPASKHLVAYRNYRKAISNAADSGIWLEIDKAVLKAVASYYGYDVSSQEAEALINFMNNEVIPKIQQHVNLTQEQINKLNAAIDRFDAIHQDVITNSLRQIISLNSTIATKLAERLDAEGKVCTTISEQICQNVACCVIPKPWPFSGCFLEDPICRQVCNTITKLQCPISEAIGQSAADLVRLIDSQLNGDNGLHNQLLQSANQLHDQLVKIKNSTLDIHNRIVDLGQVLTNNTSPAKALLQSWTADLDLALAEYVKAATNTMINTTNPNIRNGDELKPMLEWWDCYHLTLVGVPSAVGTGSCGFRGSVESVWASLENIQNIIEDAALIAPANMAGLPSPAQIRAEIDKLKQDAIDQVKQAAINELKDILPPEVQDIIAVFGDDITDEKLQYYFTKPDISGKRLLMINDIAQRIKTEMHVTADGKYDPQHYATIYNAVVLAKLALLDSNGLALLAQEASVDTNSYPLFANTPNIVADAFASIDGNHQWLQEAPPYPSSGSTFRGAYTERHPFYGYSSPAGFVLWKAEVRDVLFRNLFIGPLSPGVELAKEVGYPEILPADYPYRPCFAYPFPNDASDTTCSVSLSVNPGASPSASFLTLSASLTSAEVGTPLRLTATISGNDPSGNVVFFDNGVNIGTAPLTGSAAIMTTSSLPVGIHNITASYSGDSNNFNSLSTSAMPIKIFNPPPEFDECARYRNKRMLCP